MAKAGVVGRCVTLKLWRAVADVPDGLRKGSVGHGVCDHVSRSVTLSQATADKDLLAAELVLIWRSLGVTPPEVTQFTGTEAVTPTYLMHLLPRSVGSVLRSVVLGKEGSEGDELQPSSPWASNPCLIPSRRQRG